MSNYMNDDEFRVYSETMVHAWAFVSKDDEAMNKLCGELLEIHLSTRNLQRIPIIGDGNCFYRAVEILVNFGHLNKTFDGSLMRSEVAKHVADPSVWNGISAYVLGKTQEQFIAEITENGKWIDESIVHCLVSNIIRRTLRVHYFDYNNKIWTLYVFGSKWADPIDLIWHQIIENGTARGIHYEAAALPGLADWSISKLKKIESESSKDCTTLLRNNNTANMSSLRQTNDNIPRPEQYDLFTTARSSWPESTEQCDSKEINSSDSCDEDEEIPTSRPASAFKPVQFPAPRSAASTPSPSYAASAPVVKHVSATHIPPYAPSGSKPGKISKQDLIRREMERADRQEQRQDALIGLMVQTQQALVESQQKSDERWAAVFGSFAMIATGGAVMPAIAAKHTPALAPPALTLAPTSADRFDRVKNIKDSRAKLLIEQLIKKGDLSGAEIAMKRALKNEGEW